MRKASSSFDVAVVGGGAIGLVVGWRAAQRGLRVVVLERGEPGAGTSWVAAGMLAPITEASLVERALLGLGLASASSYPEFAQELHDASGVDPGTCAAARWSSPATATKPKRSSASSLRRRLRLPVERLRPSEARRLEPALAPALRLALDVPDDHAIDPRRLTAALAQALRRSGAELRSGAEVHALETSAAGRLDGVRLAGGERVGAEQVVIAAGSWSGAIAGIADDARVPIRPVKGQILRMHDPAGPGLLHRVLRIGGGYVVPRGDGRYVVGATMEERGFDTAVTAGAAFELLRDAIELLPGVGELEIDELSAGLRPARPTTRPRSARGRCPGCTGHGPSPQRDPARPAHRGWSSPGSLGEEPPEIAAPFAARAVRRRGGTA